MTAKFSKSSAHPVVQMVKNLINKFFQTPDIYPIRYYKKGKRFRRFQSIL